jgi:hypothetical protein
MVLVQVSDSLGATLRSVHGLMQATDVQLFRLLVTTEEQAQLSMATLPILRNWSDRLQIELAEGIEGLTLVLPSLRQLERVIASPSELLKLAQLGINELALAGSAEGSLKLNLPQWQILDLLSIHIGSDLTLTLMIRETLDLHNLLAKDVGNDVNNATVVVEDLAEVGFKGVQDLVRQGYRISTADADSLNAVALDEAEINAFMSIHLLQAAGVQDLDFERPVILSEQATRALLDSNLAAGQTQDVVGTLSAQSAPDDFFDNIGQWMQDKGLDAIEWIRVMTQAPADFVLGQSLAEFSEWALDDSIDVRIEGFLVGIPEYLLLQQSQEWIAHIETNLDVQVVGISDSDITLIQGS